MATSIEGGDAHGRSGGEFTGGTAWSAVDADTHAISLTSFQCSIVDENAALKKTAGSTQTFFEPVALESRLMLAGDVGSAVAGSAVARPAGVESVAVSPRPARRAGGGNLLASLGLCGPVGFPVGDASNGHAGKRRNRLARKSRRCDFPDDKGPCGEIGSQQYPYHQPRPTGCQCYSATLS